MFDLRNMQSLAIASAMLCYFTAAGQGAAPDVTYTATGVFVTPAVSGQDILSLAGQPFTLTFVVNEATKPTRRSETVAEYGNIPVAGAVKSGINGANYYFNGPASLVLAVGAPGTPDSFVLKFPFNYAGFIPLVITAKVSMPAGTIVTPNIKPFTAPVMLAPDDGQVTYTCPACSPPYSGYSTILAIAGGTLNAAKQ